MQKKIMILMAFLSLSFLQAYNFKVQWYPQAQFAGYIMAKEKGFFDQENVAIELLFSTGNDNILEELQDDKIQFCSSWLSEVISKNTAGSFVNMMQIFQKSSLLIISKKEKNILKPTDLNGKKVRLWGGNFAIPFQAFVNKYELKFEELPGSYTIDLFLSGACDATSGMYYNEYNKMYLAGVNYDEMNIIEFAKDQDLNFPEDGIYVTKNFAEQNPETIMKMKKAIQKGWEYAKNNPEETIQTVLKYCAQWKMKTNYAEQKWMLEKTLEATFSTGTFGKLQKSDYLKVENELQKQKIIKQQYPFKKFILENE